MKGVIAAAALVFSAHAFAQPAPSAGPTPTLGFGTIAGFRVEGPNESGDGGLGVYLRPGLQLSELFGLEDELSAMAGLIPLAGFTLLIRDTLELTFSPLDWLTLGAGATYGWGRVEAASTLGGTVRAELRFLRQRTESGGRRAWKAGLAGELGGVVQRDGPAGGASWGVFVTFGYGWY